MDIAERNGSALRCVLASAESLRDCAIALGSFQVKTPFSRLSALLSRVTLADHLLFGVEPDFSAAGLQDKDIIQSLDVSASMVAKVRQRCVEEGPEAALKDRQRPGKMAKLTDKQAAHIIAIACSDAPKGHEHWTLRLLADKVVALSYAPSFSYEAIRQLLKKTL